MNNIEIWKYKPHASTILAACGGQYRIPMLGWNLTNTILTTLGGAFVAVQTTHLHLRHLLFLEVLDLGHVLLHIVYTAFETPALFAT